MIGLVQVLIKYGLLLPFDVQITLGWFGFILLITATLCIAAAGNIINDIYDVETDLVNKPDQVIVGKSISEKNAYNLFMAFNVIGVAIGFYLSHLVGRHQLFAIFVIISALLFVYASYLKQTLLFGNIVISVLVASSLLIVGLFELMPVITETNQAIQLTFFRIIFDYAVFAFIINLIREMVKDLEDVDGDYKAKMKTLPIVLGRDRTAKIIFFLSFLPIGAVIYYMIAYLYKQPIAVGYFLIGIIAPLIYISIKLLNAETKKEFHHISTILKLVMLMGMLSMLLYPIILK
jgi:4-hydroxybenzoate polyprenyltransferase